MIDIIKQTPSIYSEESRDYQVISRLYSALFNVSKMYIDNMSIWESNIDNKLAYLRANTLNFKPKHSWDVEDLEAITSAYKYIVRNKGSKQAFEYVINILMKIHRLKNQNTKIDILNIEDGKAEIRIEEGLASIGIVEDLVKYILPAGMIYRIIPFKAADLGDDKLITEAFIEVEDIDTSKYETGARAVGDSSKTKIDLKDMSKSFIYDSDTQNVGTIVINDRTGG